MAKPPSSPGDSAQAWPDSPGLAYRHPLPEPGRRDWLILVSLARTFPGAEAAELTRAMIEGSPDLSQRTAGDAETYIRHMVGSARHGIPRDIHRLTAS